MKCETFSDFLAHYRSVVAEKRAEKYKKSQKRAARLWAYVKKGRAAIQADLAKMFGSFMGTEAEAVQGAEPVQEAKAVQEAEAVQEGETDHEGETVQEPEAVETVQEPADKPRTCKDLLIMVVILEVILAVLLKVFFPAQTIGKMLDYVTR
jgi:hypothetical protein